MEFVVIDTAPKSSSVEVILGLPLNLQFKLASISSVVEHSIFVPVEASNEIILPGLHVKALLWTVKPDIVKSSVAVVPVILGVILITTFFPSTSTRLIETSPNFGGGQHHPGSTLNISPVEWIVG